MKKKLLLSALAAVGIALPFMFKNDAHAFTIAEDGKYVLTMTSCIDDEDVTIDGLPGKEVKFNFDKKETEVKLSDLTKDVVPFNGKTKFAGWAASSDSKELLSEETKLKAADFKPRGDSGESSYTVYAKFSDEKLTGSYYLRIDPFGGKINDSSAIVIIQSECDAFQTVDLAKYQAKRDNCEFCGWDYNGAIVNSIDKNCFSESKSDVITVSAVYKSNKFYGLDSEGKLNDTSLEPNQRPSSYVLILDANGGTIEGEKSKQYDYLGGGNSGTSMKLFQYVPERAGYKFEGWNSKKDGLGENCKYIYWGKWSSKEYDIAKLNDSNYDGYLTLYAKWTKLSGEEPAKEVSTRAESEVKGNIQFETEIGENCTLDIKELEIPKALEDKNVKFMVDINLLGDNSQILEINGQKMKIKVEVPDYMRGYKYYKVAYIENGEIKEILPAVIDENGCVIFETTHLSKYGIIATNDIDEVQSGEGLEEDSEGESKNESVVADNPTTGDGITFAATLLAVSSIGMGALPVVNRRKIK